MRKLLVAAMGVLAVEVLLVWGYFAWVEVVASGSFAGITNRTVQVAFLSGAVSLLIWLGFVWGFERLVLAAVACIVITYGALVAVAFVDHPGVLVCNRQAPAHIVVSSTRSEAGGYFEKHRVGPCVTYTHRSKPSVWACGRKVEAEIRLLARGMRKDCGIYGD